MLQLTTDEADTLQRIVRAGAVDLGGACPASVAIRLELVGLVTITKGDPQRACATRKGAAFQHRSAA